MVTLNIKFDCELPITLKDFYNYLANILLEKKLLTVGLKDLFNVNGVDHDHKDSQTLISTLNLHDGSIIMVALKGMVKVHLCGMQSLYSHFN